MQGSSLFAPFVYQDSSIHREGLTFPVRLPGVYILVRPSGQVLSLGIVGLLIVSKSAELLH